MSQVVQCGGRSDADPVAVGFDPVEAEVLKINDLQSRRFAIGVHAGTPGQRYSIGFGQQRQRLVEAVRPEIGGYQRHRILSVSYRPIRGYATDRAPLSFPISVGRAYRTGYRRASRDS
jgi:hypothetical protein